MKNLWIGLLLCASASAQPWSCFSDHVSEAIQLNSERAPKYSDLSLGASWWLSKELVASERVSWFAAKGLQLMAGKFWRAGIPILCADFAPMNTAPAFKERFDFDPPKLADYRHPDVNRWVRELSFAVSKTGFLTVHQTAVRFIKDVEGPPGFHCMAKHVLESVARVAYLAPQYEALAKQKGLSSPARLARLNLKLHLQGLRLAVDLDRRAAPLQALGIPILCNDVPALDIAPKLP